MAAWPPALRTGSCDALLNFEIADHPIYDGPGAPRASRRPSARPLVGVSRRLSPHGQAMRVVTTVVLVFRRWPTTYGHRPIVDVIEKFVAVCRPGGLREDAGMAQRLICV